MSPITSSAAKSDIVAGADSATAGAPKRGGDAAAHFEGMLFAGALAPLSKALGVLGDVLTDAVATAVARGSHDSFYEKLQALIDADRRP